MFKEYLLQNWSMILVLLAFVISLITTVFLEKKTIIRMYLLIGMIFVLSIVVFLEFYFKDKPEYNMLRTVFMAVRYSATPLIIAQISYALVKRMHWLVYVPALLLLIIDIISIFTGIVFSLDENGDLVRGPLGFLPFIVVGLYSVFLITLLIIRSNKRPMEIVPIVFLAFALGSGTVLPFIFRDDYSMIFCSTIAIALFAYYEFMMLQLTKKDSLTGLLNRHAYYADVSNDSKNITALISIDMDGLKTLNDTEGHVAGDEALVTLSNCFVKALKIKQSGYRIGGDEFIIVCRKTSKEEVLEIVEKIRKNVAATKYNCSIGYAFNLDETKSVDELLSESDKMMYQEKDQHYLATGKERRRS